VSECPACSGSGWWNEDREENKPCPECSGSGSVPGTLTRVELEAMNEMYNRTIASFAQVDRSSFDTGFKAGLIFSQSAVDEEPTSDE
jgi:hypothetical protein